MKETKHYAPQLLGIADADTMYRSTLINNICFNSDRKVYYCATNGRELIENQQKLPAQLLIVDLYLPVISGIEAIQILKKTDRFCKILAISSIYQADVALLLQQLEIDGYCSKRADDISLALSKIESGHTFFDTDYYYNWSRETEKLYLKNNFNARFDLKAVEINIIQHTCEGKSNKEIGDILCLSKRTIDTYVRELLLKLNLKTKIELVNFAMHHGVCRVSCDNSANGYCSCQSLFVNDK